MLQSATLARSSSPSDGMHMNIRLFAILSATALLFPAALFAQVPEAPKKPGAPKKAAKGSAPILRALESVDADALRFNEHIVVLSSPIMEGRLPGTRGMELAKEYMEFWYKKAGLLPPFEAKAGGKTFRQPFPVSMTPKIVGTAVRVDGQDLRAGEDYAPHQSAGGKVTGKLVSVGYSFARGYGAYSSYPKGTDLKGKIALIHRGRPIGDRETRWRNSRLFSLQIKVADALRAGAAVVIFVTPSYVAGEELVTSRHRRASIPIMAMTRAAADAMLKSVGAQHTVDSLAEANDKVGVVTPLGDTAVTIDVQTKAKTLTAENVAGILPGRGALAKELVIIGGHLDHLGKGNFGSRSPARGKVLHPGADDNASGSAGVLMIAAKMAEAYEELGPNESARSVMFVGFSAEESGLHGSRYMAANPLPGHKTVLMINFDMIGRVRENKVRLSGAGTAKGLKELVAPLCDESPLDVNVVLGASGGSDHLNFLRKNIPVLTGHSGQHRDYHTERDVADKINRVGGAQVANMFAKIGFAVATWDTSIEFQRPPNTCGRRQGRRNGRQGQQRRRRGG